MYVHTHQRYGNNGNDKKECTSGLVLIVCAGLYKLDVPMWLWIYVVYKALPFVTGHLGGIPSTGDIVASGVQQLEGKTVGKTIL